MDIPLDPKWETFIAEQVASGAFATAEEVVAAGLTRLKADDDILAGWDIEELRAEVQKGIDERERGEGMPVSAEELPHFFARIREEGLRRLGRSASKT